MSAKTTGFPLKIFKDYRNTGNWKKSNDEFNKMFHQFSDNRGIKNMGGIRIRKGNNGKDAFVILVTNFSEPDWPDNINLETSVLIYYGDNQDSDKKLHETSAGGNKILKKCFHAAATDQRQEVPPFLLFQSHKIRDKSYMKFLGLAAPGVSGHLLLDDLAAVWRFKGKKPYMNYKACFTILDAEEISWEWLDDIVTGNDPCSSKSCPDAWRLWFEEGKYAPLCYKDHIFKPGF